MADNLQYQFGIDLYDGNSVRSYPSLVAWDKHVAFAYFRGGIGVRREDFKLLRQAAEQTHWALGIFYELWLATLPRDKQVEALLWALGQVGSLLKLPVSLVYEPQTEFDRKGNKITDWPSIGDLKYVAAAVANKGWKVNVCTNLSGLDRLKASGLIDMANTDWWIERYNAWPLQKTEMGVDAMLALLLSKYGIPKERVQFMQTSEAGEYPAGASFDVGADYDRAIGWKLEQVPAPEPQPVPTSIQDIAINVTGYSVELGKVFADGEDVTAISHLFTSPPVIVAPPEPAPQPEPQPAPEISTVKFGILKTQIIENGLTQNGKYTPAVVQIEDEAKPDSKKDNQVPIRSGAEHFTRAINDERGGHYALDTVGAMWINSPGKGESISCQHNFVSWEKEANNCAMLRCFQNDEAFDFDPAKVNWHTRSDVIFKAMAIDLQGDFAKVGDGIDSFIPLMACSNADGGTGELWLALDEIEPFPALPCTVTVLPGESGHVNIRETPGLLGKFAGTYDAGDGIILREYRTLGASVWARTQDGWICLLLAEKPGQRDFLTSWSLETAGVIPPEG